MHVLAILALPGSTPGSTNGLRVSIAFSEATRALSCRSESTKFAMLVHMLADPVYLGVTADGIVVNIYQNDLKIFVGCILSHPIRVQNTQSTKSATNSLLKLTQITIGFIIHKYIQLGEINLNQTSKEVSTHHNASGNMIIITYSSELLVSYNLLTSAIDCRPRYGFNWFTP